MEIISINVLLLNRTNINRVTLPLITLTLSEPESVSKGISLAFTICLEYVNVPIVYDCQRLCPKYHIVDAMWAQYPTSRAPTLHVHILTDLVISKIVYQLSTNTIDERTHYLTKSQMCGTCT